MILRMIRFWGLKMERVGLLCICFLYFIKLYLGNNKLGMLLMRIRSEYLKAVDSKSYLQPNHASIKSTPNDDVIEFCDKDNVISIHSVF